MSASSKKKLRKEEYEQKLTERQLQEQKEAKKLKLYTTLFVVALAALLVLAIGIGVYNAVTRSGLPARKTVAVTIGDHKLSNTELNYFYVDSALQTASYYGSMLGMNTYMALDQQYYDEETGVTWADMILQSAIADAQNVYAYADAANKAGFKLDQKTIDSIDAEISSIEKLVKDTPEISSVNSYLQAMYGPGANKETYRNYRMLKELSSAYSLEYRDSLSYDDAVLREAESGKTGEYNSYTFNYHFVPVSAYEASEDVTDAEDTESTESTEDVENTDSTDPTENTDDSENVDSVQDTDTTETTEPVEEPKDAAEQAKAAADSLIGETCTSVEAFDSLIKETDGSDDSTASIEVYEQLYSTIKNSTDIPDEIKDWALSSDRKSGDKTVIESTSTSTVDGKEETAVTGYYAVYYVSANENNYVMQNVRHILIQPENGTYNSVTGEYDYEDAAWADALTEAENLLKQWQDGEKTVDSFAVLANEHSADGDGTTGGLYENVPLGMMVRQFEDWCYDASRKAGDTGIVKTKFGYHIMYYVGNTDISYRDYQISEDLRSEDFTAWSTAIVDAMTVTTGNTKYLMTSLIPATYFAS